MNLGIRAHDFSAETVEELAEKISQKGFQNIQLALPKSFGSINSDVGNLSPGFGNHMRKKLAEKNVQIAVLGCYFNMVDPDENARRKSIEKFKEYIRYASCFGCIIVGSETGSFNEDYSYHVDNHGEKAFQIVLETAKELALEAEKFGVIVGLENSVTLTVHTPERMKRLLDETNSNNVQVIYDPIGFISPEKYKEQDEIIERSLDILSDRIAAVHVKDFIIENGERVIVPSGKGLLNFELLFKILKKKKPFVEFIMEDIREEFMEESIKFLRETYEKA